MPKNVLHDIMTREKRTIRQVPLPQGRKGRGTETEEETVLYEEQESYVEVPDRTAGVSRFFLWGTAFVFLILLGFALATGFSGATLTVTPKTALVEVNHEFIATKEAGGSSVHLLAVEYSETDERTVPADTSKMVTEKASGVIVVYNTFSEKPQRLIKNTRFSTSAGLIYRINESIVVPGFKKGSDGKIIPGSLEVTVFADAPGEDYNGGLTDFTIPGFKTDPARYATFFARSKTPMTGGVDGVIKTPNDALLAATQIELQRALRAKIQEKAVTAVPDDYILFDQALLLSYESLPLEVKGDVAKVRETARGTAYMLKREELEREIANQALSNKTETPITLPQLATLHLEFNEKPATDKVATSIRFKLGGSLQAIWLFDEAKLRTALLGKERSELATALSAFPTIEKVDLILRPFWSRSFPTNPKKVNIEKASISLPVKALDKESTQ